MPLLDSGSAVSGVQTSRRQWTRNALSRLFSKGTIRVEKWLLEGKNLDSVMRLSSLYCFLGSCTVLDSYLAFLRMRRQEIQSQKDTPAIALSLHAQVSGEAAVPAS